MDKSPVRERFVAEDQHLANLLFGQQNRNLKLVERTLGVRIGSKGVELSIEGDTPAVNLTRRLIEELYSLLREGYPLYPADIDYAIRILSADSSARLRDIFLDTIFISARKKIISPKSLAQKHYIDAIRKNDVVFGIGPAGTGKTYLAMAMAVAFLDQKGGQPHSFGAPGSRSWRKAGFSAGRFGGEGQSLPATFVRCPFRYDGF